MAKIQSLTADGKEMTARLKLSQEEYDELRGGDSYVSILPVRDSRLKDSLTISAIGNSYLVMLPKRVLTKHGIPGSELPKSAPAGVFSFGNGRFLVLQLRKQHRGHSVFGDKK